MVELVGPRGFVIEAGHSDVQTTLRYVDVNEDDKREAIAVVFGSPATAAQATRKQEVELEGGGG